MYCYEENAAYIDLILDMNNQFTAAKMVSDIVSVGQCSSNNEASISSCT